MKIAVLCGGLSPERQVSIESGAMVAHALTQAGHEVMLLDLAGDATTALFHREGVSPLPPEMPAGSHEIGVGVIARLREADRAFLALHGGVGEDGRLQGLLECMGVSYTGSDAVGSMLAMDKLLSKRLLDSVGIPTPRWMEIDPRQPTEELLHAVGGRLGYPCVIKPAASGSSLGVMMADDKAALLHALEDAKETGGTYLAERRIVGRELTVALLGEQCLPPVEICPREGFYDYNNKYSGKTRELCPADISPDTLARAEAFSHAAAHILRLRGYARFDFMLDHTGGLWLLEANTLPGMTENSLLPLAARTAGIGFPRLCQIMLDADVRY